MRVLVTAIWALVLGDAVLQGYSLPDFTRDVGEIPVPAAVLMIVMPLVLFAVSGRDLKAGPYFFAPLARWVDARA